MDEKQRIRVNLKAIRHKKKNARAVVETRWRNKMRLIQYKGGKCMICGYSKPIASAYHFHHIDAKKKEFTVSKFMSRSLESLKKEVDKCDLVCGNCHAEIHDKENAISREQTIKSWQDWNIEEEARRKRKLPHEMNCKFCGSGFQSKFKDRSFCSIKCRIQGSRKIADQPSKIEIEKMLETMTWTAIGRRYGVSDNTVRNWYKQNG